MVQLAHSTRVSGMHSSFGTDVIDHIIHDSHQPAMLFDRASKKFIDCNDKALHLLGYDNKAFFLSLPLADYLAQQQFDDMTPAMVVHDILKHFLTNDVFMRAVVALKADGSSIILEMFGIRDFYSDQPRSVFFFREVDSNYLAQKAVLGKNHIYQTILKSGFDFVDIHEVFPDPDNSNGLGFGSKLVDRSDNMKETLGIGNQTLASPLSLMKITPASYLKHKQEQLTPLFYKLKRERKLTFDWQVYDKNKNIIHLNVGAYLLNIKDKVLLVRIMRDITTKIKKEAVIQKQYDELKAKNEKLEAILESNTQLENFAQIASHDIKAPLRTINSFVQLLQKKIATKLSADEKELFQFISSGTNDLSVLVSDLLAYSKSTQKGAKISEIDMPHFAEMLERNLASSIIEKNAQIHFNNLPHSILADRVKLMRVFQNIISNALKFSKEETTPTIIVDHSESQDHWTFTIKDNGIGIEEEYLNDVFTMFRKLNGKTYPGSGMGLALCKNIIEQHQGSIRVDSVFGVGTVFTFTISKHLEG